jgi:acetone monooxygenase
VHGYPNLFTTAAPLAPSAALCNMTTCLQQQVDWITDCILYMEGHGYKRSSRRARREAGPVGRRITTRSPTPRSSPRPTPGTWANVEGKPRRLLSYIGGVGNYRKFCDEAKDSNYAGFEVA